MVGATQLLPHYFDTSGPVTLVTGARVSHFCRQRGCGFDRGREPYMSARSSLWVSVIARHGGIFFFSRLRLPKLLVAPGHSDDHVHWPVPTNGKRSPLPWPLPRGVNCCLFPPATAPPPLPPLPARSRRKSRRATRNSLQRLSRRAPPPSRQCVWVQ